MGDENEADPVSSSWLAGGPQRIHMMRVQISTIWWKKTSFCIHKNEWRCTWRRVLKAGQDVTSWDGWGHFFWRSQMQQTTQLVCQIPCHGCGLKEWDLVFKTLTATSALTLPHIVERVGVSILCIRGWKHWWGNKARHGLDRRFFKTDFNGTPLQENRK